MAIEIVDVPIKNGGSFHSYVKLPEGTIKYNMIDVDGISQFHLAPPSGFSPIWGQHISKYPRMVPLYSG